MRNLTIVVSLLAAVAFAGCKKDEAKAPDPAPVVTPDAAVAKPDPAAADPGEGGHGSGTGGGSGGGGSMGAGGTGKMENKMANCPSAVAGATTTVADTKDAVEITVVAKDKAATEEIRTRGKKLAEAAKVPDAPEVKHSGTGTGGGEIGHCPIVLGETTVEVADVDGGSKFTVKPAKPDGLAALAAESKRRNDALPAAAPGDKPAEKAPPK